ncbi:MAG: carboxylate-amine ligase [Myxococcales bacterium]|nr:carboxylate-amine ligase [Myxococcales bacterium]
MLPEFPSAESTEEIEDFARLQARLPNLFREVFPNPLAPRTVVVIPSLSLDQSELKKVSGVHHYEERMLCMLMLLRLPCTRVIYVTSQPIVPAIIDYFLGLLSGIPGAHARKRLLLFSCHDASPTPLTQKVLSRPRLVQRLRELAGGSEHNHLVCFNSTPLERTLAVRLGLPLYACDPALSYLGSKSGSREVFKAAGVLLPDGFEGLRDERDVVESLVTLKRRYPDLRRAVVKLNEGFSGEGNALFSYGDLDANAEDLDTQIRQRLPSLLRFEAKDETWPRFSRKFEEMGGIVECFVEGENKHSPSVQCRINPLGEVNVISTHDQVLGGPSGQIFLGCTFPAIEDYRLAIQDAGQRISEVLRDRGVLGRYSVDFISVPKPDGGWDHYAIEINLRKGGTTHPFMTLQFLTDGLYDLETGLYKTPAGQPRYYYASDNLESERYKGLAPEDLIDIAVYHGLHYHGATQQGVAFHLIGALSEFGKFGVLCIGDTPEQAQELYTRTVEVMDGATKHARGKSVPLAHSFTESQITDVNG